MIQTILNLQGPMLDASKQGGLTMPEKHDLVYEIAKGTECGPEILHSWTRKEILRIICAEMGKERKYTGLPKCKMIEHLLRIVAKKESIPQENGLLPLMSSTPEKAPSVFRRQRKKEHPLRLTAATMLPPSADGKVTDTNRVCKNSACRAILSSEDLFCRRCSCCICYQFDDNKDPSVWLVCSSEPVNEDISCGLSCHVECALKHKKAGVIKDGQHVQDGRYCCASCGRISGLIGFWKKQFSAAKDARRVDVLCYRLSLSQRLLNGTEQFKDLYDIILNAVKILEEEVGPINGVSSKMARGIVSRLSSGLEVQKLCAMAVEKTESLLLSVSPVDSRVESPLPAACRVQFEDVCPTSLVVSLKEIELKTSEDVVGYKLWHRKSRELNYPRDLTCILPRSQRRALISNLQPCTEYAFKIISFTDKVDIGQSEAKCFTKSVEVFRGNHGSNMTKGPQKKHGNLGMKDFSPNSAKGVFENQPKGVSSFRVRDLGKILRAVWAQERETNEVFDFSDKNMQINQFGSYENDEVCDTDKPFIGDDRELNIDPSSPLDVSRDDEIGCNLVQVAEPDDQEESISALDDARVMAGMSLLKMSHAQGGGSPKDLKKSINGSQVIKLSKKKYGKHSKVSTSQKSSTCEPKQMIRHDMEVVPLDCSYPVFHVNSCNVEDPQAGRLNNGCSNSNGSDSENWAVQPMTQAPAVDSQTGISRKRAWNTRDKLNEYDGCLQNGGQMIASDSPDCLEKNYEDSVKIIRWLECEGHIKEEFRKKFLTWFSLRATAQERRIVYAFIETLLGDPTGLAEQLVDTFLDIISKKRPQLSNGFCTKLWH